MYDQRSSLEVSDVSRLCEEDPLRGSGSRSSGQAGFTLRELATAHEEHCSNEAAEDQNPPDTVCTPRTLHVTGHLPRLRSSLPPRYPNWQRKRTQNPHSEGSNPSRGTS
jgi:hypothetical protein